MKPTVSIAIATLNRCDDLRATLVELQNLDPPPFEILVCLDGCTDGSKEMLDAFSSVTVIENAQPQGSVTSRDRLFRMARGDLIVSLDDDSFPMQPDFITRLADLAEARPEAGVFAFEEVRPVGRDNRLFDRPTGEFYVASYPNCAGALRASLYGRRASYPLFFFHMYEEPDFCLQTYANGYGVLYTPSIKIFHRYTHTLRNPKSRHHMNARNEFWSVLMRCPFPHVIWLAAYRMARQVVYGASQGWSWLVDEPKWIWDALRGIRRPLAERKPIPWHVYWPWIRLARHPIRGDSLALKRMFPNTDQSLRESQPTSQP